ALPGGASSHSQMRDLDDATIEQPLELRSMSMTALIRSTCLVVAAVTVSCSSSSPSAPVDVNQHGLDFTAFDSAMNAGLAAHGLAGASVVIVQKDSGMVYLKGYGAYDRNRVYLLASASKILSVGVAMRLADQQVLSIDAPIGTYVSSTWGDDKS